MNGQSLLKSRLAYQVGDVFRKYDSDFDPTFRAWLRENFRIYVSFHLLANQMRRYREHYSARTVIENIRWNTDLESTDTLFKINNNITPDMARMYNRLTNSTFFEERAKQTKGDDE